MTSPLRRPILTLRPSDRSFDPILVFLSSSGETIITFETWMGASRSAMPPLMFFCGLGRVWRLMKFAPCTITLPFSGSTISTLPRLPASRPEMISTRSFFFRRILTRSRLRCLAMS